MSSVGSSSSSPFVSRIDEKNQQLIYSDNKRLGYIIDHEGKVWFPASDTAKVLEYTNPIKAVQDHVEKTNPECVKYLKDIMEKGKCQVGNESLPTCQSGYIRPNRRREMGSLPKNKANKKYINEAGFYQLAMRSKMKAAIQFQKWVCEEVLPAIRKTGKYSLIPETTETAASERDPIEDLQTRVDAIEITKTKCDIIRATIPNACPNDYAIVHDITNQISLDTTLSTAEIKEEFGIVKGLSVPDVLNDCSQERRMMADIFFAFGLHKKKDQLNSLPPKERAMQLRGMKEEINTGVDNAPFMDHGEPGVIPNDEAKKRKKNQQIKRKSGEIEASRRAIISISQMQQPLLMQA